MILAVLAGCGGASTGALPPGGPTGSASSATAVAPQQIGTDKMAAIYRECFYALRQSEINNPTDTVGPQTGLSRNGWTVSNWNYLASAGATDWTNDLAGWASASQTQAGIVSMSVASNFSDKNGYALRSGIGRGGSSQFFACYILHRSVQYTLPYDWYDLQALSHGTYDGYARDAYPGDIILSGSGHVAIVVVRYSVSSTNPALYGLDVVDSDWSGMPGTVLGGPATGHSEIICRHLTPAATLGNNWRKISGRGRWW
jgi:hypothetical protein